MPGRGWRVVGSCVGREQTSTVIPCAQGAWNKTPPRHGVRLSAAITGLLAQGVAVLDACQGAMGCMLSIVSLICRLRDGDARSWFSVVSGPFATVDLWRGL
jgi:hypothetical protein